MPKPTYPSRIVEIELKHLMEALKPPRNPLGLTGKPGATYVPHIAVRSGPKGPFGEALAKITKGRFKP